MIRQEATMLARSKSLDSGEQQTALPPLAERDAPPAIAPSQHESFKRSIPPKRDSRELRHAFWGTCTACLTLTAYHTYQYQAERRWLREKPAQIVTAASATSHS